MGKEINYFKAFCKVSKAFGTTLSEKKLLDLVVESAIDTMDAKASCAFMRYVSISHCSNSSIAVERHSLARVFSPFARCSSPRSR